MLYMHPPPQAIASSHISLLLLPGTHVALILASFIYIKPYTGNTYICRLCARTSYRVHRCSYYPLTVPGAPMAAASTASLNHSVVRHAKYLKYPCRKVSSRKDGALNYAPIWRTLKKGMTSFHIHLRH